VDGLIVDGADITRPQTFGVLLAEPYRIKVVKATTNRSVRLRARHAEDKFKKETLELINAMYPNKKPQSGQLFKIVE
jgi:predicted Zn-dependent protease